MRKLVSTEARLYLRDPMTVFWGLTFPLVLLGVLGAVPSFREPSRDLGGARAVDLYVPIIAALVLAMMAVTALPSILADYRDRGILRRLATTPVGPARLLGAQLLVNSALVVIAIALVLGLGAAVFGVGLPAAPIAYLVSLGLAMAALLGLGLLLAALAPSSRAASAISTLLFFPMMFFAGLWAPREAMSPLLRDVSDATPLGAAVGALQSATEGAWPSALHLLVLAVWAAVCAGLATRLFRWQ
jgi:ABC-2 type transport system permease protein